MLAQVQCRRQAAFDPRALRRVTLIAKRETVLQQQGRSTVIELFRDLPPRQLRSTASQDGTVFKKLSVAFAHKGTKRVTLVDERDTTHRRHQEARDRAVVTSLFQATLSNLGTARPLRPGRALQVKRAVSPRSTTAASRSTVTDG